MPMWRRNARSWLGVEPKTSPSNSIVPRSGRSRPLMQRSSVLFPEPLRPMIATTSPGSIVSDTSSSAWWLPNRLEMPLNAKSGIYPPFQPLGQQRQRPAHHEIQSGHDRIDDHRLEGRVGHQLAGTRQLDEADDGGDRGGFDELDGKAHRRRDRDPRGLRQDHVPELLGIAERQAFRGFPLRARDRLDRAAPDLAEEGARIEGEGEQYRGPWRDLEIEQHGEAVIDDEELHQHGRALEQLDIAGREPAQRAIGRNTQDRDHQTQNAAADHRPEREQQGPGNRQQEIEELVEAETAPHGALRPPGRAGTRPSKWCSMRP